MKNRRELGNHFEDVAANHLLELGYTIVTRRYTCKGGEIDIIALDNDVLVFAEVKFRSKSAPESAVDFKKTTRFRVAVDDYLHKTGSHRLQTRFDLIAITGEEIRHHVGGL